MSGKVILESRIVEHFRRDEISIKTLSIFDDEYIASETSFHKTE
jgi:hypothetical protein